MKSLNKSVSSVFLAFLMTLTMISGFAIPVNAVTNEPSRVINIVYDDSTSMYSEPGVGKLVDTWCQAKYAMEVFVSMMGEKDTINIYYMSDYYQTDEMPGPRITLLGSDSVSSNVSKIHNAKTVAGGTPFNSVRKAYSDLAGKTADKKWLVVLTDGNFDHATAKGKFMPKAEVDSFFNSKSDDISVCFLAIGKAASTIKASSAKNIFSYQAKTNDKVLEQLTNISSRVFEKNKLKKVDKSNGKIQFDVSMQELIVFAQGADVKINGIKGSDGTLISSSEAPVTVQYSDCDAEGRNNKPVTDLVGKIATFKKDFTAGSYTVDVSGAKTLEVFYKPNLEIAISLTDSEGNPIDTSAKIKAGDYKLSVNLIDAVTKNVVTSSDLLGAVKLEATVTNNGETKPCKNGDTIQLVQGPSSIEASANYLEYNTLEVQEEFTVGVDKTITFSVSKDVNYEIDKNGFKNNDYVIVHAMVDGREFTAEEWAALNTPTIDLYQKNEKHPLSFLSRIIALFSQINGTYDKPVIEKGDAVGDLKIRPSLPDGKPTAGNYIDSDYIIKCSQVINYESWDGSETGTFKVTDGRSFIAKYWRFFIFCLVLAIILFILAGYLPLFKNYLPKGLVRKPHIDVSSPNGNSNYAFGKFEKNLASTLIPYVSERGELKFTPPVFSGFPKAKVKAIKGRMMELSNQRSFLNKNVFFNGIQVTEEKQNKVKMGASAFIQATNRNGSDSTCYLNQRFHN